MTLRGRLARSGRLWRRAAFEARRVAHVSYGFAVAAAFLALLWHGYFPDLRRPGADLGRSAAAVVLTAVLAGKIAARVRTGERRRSRLREAVCDAELGLLLLAVTYVLLAISGGAASPVYPLAYALVSFLVTFHRLAVGLPLALAAVGFEAVICFGPAATPAAAAAFPGHAGFLVIFALLNVVFLHAEVARQRRERRRRLEAEVASMREEARDFRLISSALPAESRVRTRAEEEEKLSQGSIETIHQQLLHTLELLKQAMGLQTCALLWLDHGGERLKVKELATDALHVAEVPIPAGSGAVGAALKEGKTLLLRAPKPSQLPYYQGPVEVAAFIGVPLVEGVTTRGLLVADRAVDRPFDARDAELMESAAAQVLRIVQSERVFGAVERSKHEHERFYRASAALNRALTLSEVYEAAIAGARGVCDFELAAISTYDAARGNHVIRCAVGEGGGGLVGTVHRDASAIVSMVVKNRLALPAGGDFTDPEVPVFSEAVRLHDFASLLVLPLLVKDEVLGTFTVAARRPAAFPGDRREMLGVIANQVAISLQNGRMVQALEEQATTDGLTGLVNHRTFQERFSAMLKRAERHETHVSLVLTDIDHFKRVNDTYGHPTGDEVLRRVAAILKASARDIDIVARYGGEEFAMVLEATDRAGARRLAERVRLEVARQSFTSEKGLFQTTLSLGVAAYPEDARDKQEIIARADRSLYVAKHAGRNRTVCFGEIDRSKLKKAV